MITPRITRLLRVPDLKSLHSAIACTVWGDEESPLCAVLVPTGGAAAELRRTLENRRPQGRTRMPQVLTRADFYERLHRSGDFPPLLSAHAREVLLRRAARTVAAAVPPPFSLRAGLIVEMLRFYDELRRREQSLGDFSRKVTSELAFSAETDRGAERLLRQTEFLAAAYAEFERLTHDTGAVDEHRLRTLLLAGPERLDCVRASKAGCYQDVVVTVADQAADARGLFASDFDLLARLPGVRRLTIVATENVLAAGFHERLRDLLPGIDEMRFVAPSTSLPTLVAPPVEDGEDRRWFTSRDREEELADFIRELSGSDLDFAGFDLFRGIGGEIPQNRTNAAKSRSDPGRCAIVYQRPLPYLYLARHVFPDAGIPYQSTDALPLSAEPFAAAIDLVLSFLTADGNRASTIALLSSPQFNFPCDAASVAALDRRMLDVKFSGGWERLAVLDAAGHAAPALIAANLAAAELTAVRTARSADAQFDALLAFVCKFENGSAEGAPWHDRHARARAAIIEALESLRDAHARHDNEPLTPEEFATSIRRWIDAQTCVAVTGTAGVRLLDAAAAAYADVDEVRLVGLVDGDWPDPAENRVFYPSSILTQLGWPADASRSSAERARFRDLIALPRLRVSATAFTLEDDALIAVSPFAEELETAGLPVERRPPPGGTSLFTHEKLVSDSLSGPPPLADPAMAEWLAVRASRTAPSDDRYHGSIAERSPKTYAVSHVERYLECPFKYYAAHVLRLPEERDEEPGLTPQERGHFIHQVFEQFFDEWQRSGRQTITTENVDDAIATFERVVDSTLDALPESDRSLERTHLVGSAAAAGLAERAFAFEIEQGGEVLERLIEHPLEGTFEFETSHGKRAVGIRAKADRIDLMADGTLRVIDYKLGRAPKLSRALQLPIYGVCAEHALAGHRGRRWKLERAGYVAFKEKDAFVPLGGRSPLAAALKEGQQRFVDAVDGIERGDFPVRPDEPFRCQWCAYAGVCRKDYVGDD